MAKKTYPFLTKSRSGFTFIELLLVVVIIGIIIAVIVPRAWRANIEAKYGLLQQAATELGSWGMTWAERNVESQSEADTCILDDYVTTLNGYTGDQTAVTNWTGSINGMTAVCRTDDVTFTVSDIMPPEKQPRNPFNGLSYFAEENNGASLQTGLLFLGVDCDTAGYKNYYFVYTGTDSSGLADWHAGMGSTPTPPLANLRNGVFVARLINPGECEEGP